MEGVSLFIPCSVDLLLADLGQAMVKIIRRAGGNPYYRPEQTCCGHPAITSGHVDLAVDLAKRFVEIFEKDECIVCPAGSCVYTVKHLYPRVLKDEPAWQKRASDVASRVYELSEYLVDVLGVEDLGAQYPGKVAYHESCSLLRHLGIDQQPKRLISGVKGTELVPLVEADTCCGFGGEFALKFPELSGAIVGDKVQNFVNSGADILLLADPGCLLNIAGYIMRHNPEKKVMHLAQFLAANLREVTA